MHWYLTVLRKYAVFKGRARRKEYWMFVLVNMLVGFCFGFIAALARRPELLTGLNIYQVAVVIPSLAAGVRRMHDTNHRGWWILVPFYNLYLLCRAGDEEENRFGPSPKDPQGQNRTAGPAAMEQLEKLARLREAGHLSEEEFSKKKKQLLAS